MENWAQAEGRVSAVLEVDEAADPAGRRRRTGHRTAPPAAASIPCAQTRLPGAGTAPAFAFATGAVWWFKETAVRLGPVEKPDPPDVPGLCSFSLL